ncbi:MAG: TatD family hydrolase [Opitutaceae bacterium]|nr:TatD family hydrolase [Opitutaceae bacterium]
MLIDTHTHLEGFARHGELEPVLARAREAGVTGMITIGTEPGDWALYREIVAAHPGVVHYTIGLHPCSVAESWETAVAQLESWTAGAGEAPVAIGETGLDRFHLPKNDLARAEALLDWQKASFREHLRVAAARDLPVVVHSRGAAEECIDLIDAAGFDWRRVVFHCFTEGPDLMRRVNERGGRGSFGGVATYKSAGNVREAALAQGLGRLMLETDAPYLTPEPHRGKRNEPALMRHTAEALASLFSVDLATLATSSSENARAFFRI